MTVLGRNAVVFLTLLVTWLLSEASLNDAQPLLESVSQYGQTDFTIKERIDNSDTKIRVGDIPAVPGDVRMRRPAKAVPRINDYVPMDFGNYTDLPLKIVDFHEPGYLFMPDFPPYDYGRAMRVGVASGWALALSGLVAIAVLLTP